MLSVEEKNYKTLFSLWDESKHKYGFSKRHGPIVGEFVYLLLEILEFKDVVRPHVYRMVVVNNDYRTVAALEQLQPSNVVIRPPFPSKNCKHVMTKIRKVP